jgi:hypothetical protein
VSDYRIRWGPSFWIPSVIFKAYELPQYLSLPEKGSKKEDNKESGMYNKL